MRDGGILYTHRVVEQHLLDYAFPPSLNAMHPIELTWCPWLCPYETATIPRAFHKTTKTSVRTNRISRTPVSTRKRDGRGAHVDLGASAERFQNFVRRDHGPREMRLI